MSGLEPDMLSGCLLKIAPVELAQLDRRGLSAQAVADELGIAERTVRRWVQSGRLPARRKGRSFIIDLDDALRLHGQAPIGRSDRARIERDRELDQLRTEVQDHRGELMELRGRYAEVVERLEQAERELAAERRATARLELLLEQSAA
jgi:excisionase family DNA binding protein